MLNYSGRCAVFYVCCTMVQEQPSLRYRPLSPTESEDSSVLVDRWWRWRQVVAAGSLLLLPDVELHVACQVALVLEGTQAQGAHEPGLLGVAPGVSVQSALAGKHGRADYAPERLSAGGVLLLHVLDECHLEAKLAAAHVTRERLLARVPAHVRRHVGLVVEAAATHWTRKWLLPRVRALVPLVSDPVGGHKWALVAGE